MSDDSDGRPTPWGVLGSVWLLLVAMVAYEIVPASYFSLVIADLGVGPTGASWLVSVVYLAMAALAIPAGVTLDRTNNRRMVVLSTLLLAAATAWGWWAAVAGDYPSLLASRFAGGVGMVTAWTAGVNIVGAAFAADRQATAIGALSTSVPAGLALGQFSGPAIAGALGWPATFPVFGGVALAAAIGFWVASARVDVTVGDGGAPTWSEFRAVLTDRNVLAISLVAFATFYLTVFFNSWMPTYIVDRFEVTLQVGGLFAAVFPAVGVVSRSWGGVVSDRYFGTRRRPVLLGAFVVSTPLVLLTGLVDVIPLLLFCLFVVGFAIQMGLALQFTVVRELVEPNVVGTALAVLNTAGFVGSMLAPVVAGSLLEATGSFLSAFVVGTGLALAGLALAWTVPETGPSA